MNKWHGRVVLLLFAFGTWGCHSFYPAAFSPATSWKPDKTKDVLLVVRKDGESVRLARPSIDSISIRGVPEAERSDGNLREVQIPLSDVDRVYVKKLDFWDTFGLVTLLSGGAFLVLLTLQIVPT